MNPRTRSCQILLLTAAIVFSIYSQAGAHFVWVYAENGKVKVVFGEGLEPDQAQFLTGLSEMKTYTVLDGQSKQVKLEQRTEGDEGWFEISQNKLGRSVEVSCPYGVFGRGDKKMFLDYSAKHVICSGAEKHNSAAPSKNLSLDLIPQFRDGKLNLTVYFNGQPLKGAEVELEVIDTDSLSAITGDSGQVSLQLASRYVIRAKHTVMDAGEIDGKEFSERRYYCTLVLDVSGTSNEKKTAPQASKTNDGRTASNWVIEKVDANYAEFPRGMTSFGAAVVNGCVYVIGGKSGKAHSYAKSYQNRNVYRLNLKDGGKNWQVVADNLGLQGLAIVGHADRVYRIGGLEARNQEGDDHDLHSVDFVKALDLEKKTWLELPKLPMGRSSFDACIVGNHIYVIGGWTMAGDKETVWATEMLKLDLSQPDAQWQAIKAPFKTRALAVRCHQEKLFVIGGIQEKGGPTNAVHVFDLKTAKWTTGPEVPTEGQIKAFGCSAVSLGKHLLVSTYDGGIFKLNADAASWDKVHQLDAGRFFHQMLPVGKSKFALVGGSHMEHGSHREIEVFELTERKSNKKSEPQEGTN